MIILTDKQSEFNLLYSAYDKEFNDDDDDDDFDDEDDEYDDDDDDFEDEGFEDD